MQIIFTTLVAALDFGQVIVTSMKIPAMIQI
jgi:hypothetical protein